MANLKKDDKDIKKVRCVSLSDNEIDAMKRLSGTTSLTEAIRLLFKMAELSEESAT